MNRYMMLLVRYYALLILLVYPISLSFATEKKTNAIIAIEAFEGFCLQNMDDFGGIDRMALSLKLKKMPDEYIQGDPVLRKLGGKAYYLLDGKGLPIGIVSYATKGGCTVYASNTSPSEVIAFIRANYRVDLIGQTAEGMQHEIYFKLAGNSKFSGSMLTIIYPSPATGNMDVSLSVLPKSVLEVDPKIRTVC